MVRLEDLKQQYPDPPEFIHRMILDEVEKQIKDSTTEQIKTADIRDIRKKQKRSWTLRRTAVAVLAAAMTIGMVGFAAVSIYHLQIKKNGAYGIDTKVTSDADENVPLPEKIAEVQIQADYIPEGMYWRDEYHLEYKDNPAEVGFSMFPFVLDAKSDELNLTDKYVVEKEEIDFGDRKGIYLRKEEGTGVSQKIYLLYPEVHRILQIFIGDEISKEEAYKVASNIKLVETEEMRNTSELESWNDYIQRDTTGIPSEIMSSVPKTDIPVHEIGTAFTLKDVGEDMEGNLLEPEEIGRIIEVAVDSVEILDDASVLAQDRILSTRGKENIGPDGKILKNQLSYIRKGDGINTLDEVIRTEEAEQKLVLVTATYTNKGEERLDDICYFGNVLLVNETDDEYRIYSYDEEGYDEISGQTYDQIEQTGCTGGEMIYCSVQTGLEQGAKNYISSLEPGESVQVKMAWITNEKDLGNMYLNLCANGGLIEFTKYMMATGIVDIRQ